MGEDGKADGGWCLARRLIAIDVILAALTVATCRIEACVIGHFIHAYLCGGGVIRQSSCTSSSSHLCSNIIKTWQQLDCIL